MSKETTVTLRALLEKPMILMFILGAHPLNHSVRYTLC